MKAVATFTTKTYARPYPFHQRITEKLQPIRTRETMQKLIRATFNVMVTIIALSLISYAAIKLNETRISASYISEAYKIVINSSISEAYSIVINSSM